MIGNYKNALRACVGEVCAKQSVFFVFAILLLCANIIVSPAKVFAQTFEPGMAVASCSANEDADTVVAIEDLRNPAISGGALGQVWNNAPANPNQTPIVAEWSRDELGQVFGLSIGVRNNNRTSPDIFVSSTDIYQEPPYLGSATTYPDGRYAIYRLNPEGGLGAGEYELFAQVASVSGANNAQSSLGQVAYNKDDRVLYASNFDDGNIYAFADSQPAVFLSSFDHGVARVNEIDPSTGLNYQSLPDNVAIIDTPNGRFVWGVQYNSNERRLYYAVHDDENRNSIWSVGLLPSGIFDDVSIRREFEVDNLYSGQMVSDIAFTFDGNSLMIAERYKLNPYKGSPHLSRVLHYSGGTGAWTVSPVDNRQRIGFYTAGTSRNNNSAGGLDYSYDYNSDVTDINSSVPEGRILATSDAMTLGSSIPSVYGIQSTALSDRFTPFDLDDHYLIDLNGILSGGNDKTQIGDVEAYRLPYNDAPNTLKICKVAGDGVEVGDEFFFDVSGVSTPVSLPAGPAPGGYCQVVEGSFNEGDLVTVTEISPLGIHVTDIGVQPDRPLDVNLDDGIAIVEIGSGVTELTFENDWRTGYLEICKWTNGEIEGEFIFDIEGTDFGSITVPANSCSPALEVPADVLTISERPDENSTLEFCTAYPNGRSDNECDADSQSMTLTVPQGGISDQTVAFFGNAPRRGDSASRPAARRTERRGRRSRSNRDTEVIREFPDFLKGAKQ